MNFATILGNGLSWMTLAGQILVLVIIVSVLFIKNENALINFVKKNGNVLALIVSLVALLGSLSYSDILGYEPCKLCWLQRIVMYPQVIILAVGIYIKDRNATLYALILSMIGVAFSWYHYLMQLGFIPASCETVGYSVSCAKVFTMNLGYITIPLMACTAFVMNIVFLLIYRNATSSTVTR